MNERKDLIETIQQSVGGCTRYWAEIIVDFISNAGWRLQRWIPCSEKMPEDVIPYINSKHATLKVLVTIKNKNGYCVRSQTRIRYEYAGKRRWEWGKYTAGDIVAWMPLPEPYKEEEDD